MSKNAGDYVARICWNGAGWARPTGEARVLEGEGTYARDMGFGHEEWLFDERCIVDGYKYGFVQGVFDSRAKLRGSTFKLRLYTVGPRHWFHVGIIDRCEALTEEQASRAVKEYRRRGWFKTMKRELEDIGADPDGLTHAPEGTFCLRFRFRDLRRPKVPLPIPQHDPLRQLRRYILARTPDRVRATWPRRAPRLLPKDLTPYVQTVVEREKEIDREHDRLQNALVKALRRRLPKAHVEVERDYVDIRVTTPKSTYLIEVKKNANPQDAITASLGQLLTYAARCEVNRKRLRLVVAAPGTPGRGDAQFMANVGKILGLPFTYLALPISGRLQLS